MLGFGAVYCMESAKCCVN